MGQNFQIHLAISVPKLEYLFLIFFFIYFVGNLSFKTKDQALETEFAQSGKVVKAKVIRDFNGRSLGYGFVEMATLEDAKRSVEAMNKKTIDERQINVEL